MIRWQMVEQKATESVGFSIENFFDRLCSQLQGFFSHSWTLQCPWSSTVLLVSFLHSQTGFKVAIIFLPLPLKAGIIGIHHHAWLLLAYVCQPQHNYSHCLKIFNLLLGDFSLYFQGTAG